MHGLLQRIERQQLQRVLQRGLEMAGLPVMGEQPRHHFQRPLAEPLALGEQPLLERRLLQAQAGQEVALVEP